MFDTHTAFEGFAVNAGEPEAPSAITNVEKSAFCVSSLPDIFIGVMIRQTRALYVDVPLVPSVEVVFKTVP